MCTLTNSRGIPFGAGGCQAPVGAGVCGETRTLDIVNEFKRLYEEKMQQIDTNGGGDCLQEKFILQQQWIGDLTEQNELLVRAVEELEHEATERVTLLEQKLQQSAQCICEVVNRYREYDFTSEILEGPRKRIFNLENDQKNLLEFIRRIREERRWTVDGLTFYEINQMDLLGKNEEDTRLRYLEEENYKVENKISEKEGTINSLQAKIDYVYSFGDIEELSIELKKKIEECNSLKQAMVDMRQALTEEVATKHDTILQLKRDCQGLEDRCIQADKQTAFRDDIIKELRKEIKHLKQQINQDEILKLNRTIDELRNTLQTTKRLQDDEEQVQTVQTNGGDSVDSKELLKKRDDVIKVQTETLKLLQDQLKQLKEAEVAMKDEKERLCLDIQRLNTQVDDLQGALRDSESKANNLQMAVDLYMNSINVLEATEEKYKLEIEQQRATISNLQTALVAVKQELDDVKGKSEDNVSLGWTARWFGSSPEPKVANNVPKNVHDI